MAAFNIIAHIKSDFPEKFGIPRQSGIVPELRATVIFQPPYRNPDALRGLEAYSHIWLLWGFSQLKQDAWSPTVRPPKLGGNARVGVFATRSPYRPSPIGLSSVKIDRIQAESPDGPLIHVLGADLMDGTPIYDIKPYLPLTDCHTDATGGLVQSGGSAHTPLQVHIDENCLARLPGEEQGTLRALLAQDPRPAYHEDPCRVYGMRYGDFEVKFSVADGVLTVIEIRRQNS